MNTLEHLNLTVRDIPETLAFYQAAFPHWQVRGSGDGDWYGKPYNWVHFGDDYQYLTFNDRGEGENRNLKGRQMGLNHFAYNTDDIAAITKRLTQAGYEVANEGADDSYRDNVYFIDPNGFEVEFVEYRSDIPEERNLYQ